MAMKKKKIIILTVFLLILTVLVVYAVNMSADSNSKKADSKKTDTPQLRDIKNKTFASGKILPGKEVEIKSLVSGIVEEIYVNTGQSVKKGDKLLRVKIIPDPAVVNGAESRLKLAKINMEDAEKVLKRQNILFKEKVISEVDFNQSKIDFDRKQEELITAKRNLKLVKEGASNQANQRSNIISATLDGMILGVSTKIGASVIGSSSFQGGTPLMLIADMNRLIFSGNISESDVDKLKLGMELKLNIGAIEGHEFRSILGFIAPKGDELEGTVKFAIQASVLQEEDYVIRAGYSANAEIVLEEKKQVLSIKESNISFSNDSAFVDVQTEKDKFEEKYIEVGISDGIFIEVKSGLTKEDEIKKKRSKKDMGVQISM